MKDDLQFAIVAAVAGLIVVCLTVLAVTDSNPIELHGALLFILGGLVGVAVPKNGGGK